MKKFASLLLLTGGLALAPATRADPLLDSWLTTGSRRYARLYENDAEKKAGAPVTTWNRGSGTQSSPVYAGVVQVSSSSSWVYLRASGLGYHVLGPWYLDAAHTQNFPNFPADTSVLYRFPRAPTVAATKTLTGGGPIGYFVDGVAAFDDRDTFSYITASATDADPGNGLRGDGVWNREAYVNEGVTFDAASAHQAGATYHYHANTPALRFELGDHVSYDATAKAYTESTAAVTAHSPILGWLADGYPVYGPYGYNIATDPASGVRRMRSGYARRDGTNGTANLATTGRTTLPAWAARAQNRSASLPTSAVGPAVSTLYTLGHYLEDYEYLGDLGKTQGTDFDLDVYNGRFCVTPEFPQGTYAYFISIEADGSPKFPNIVGRWFYGTPSGGAVTSVNESVTEYIRASQASAIAVTATNAGGSVTLTWTSVEGGTYRIDTSADGTNWTTLAPAVLSSGGDSSNYITTTVTSNYRVTLIALATYDAKDAGGISGVGNTANAALLIGTSGTAQLTAISARVAVGGVAGTPIPGFVLNGSTQVLLRAVGPSLTGLGIANALADPQLSLMSGSTVLATNDNWMTADAATMAAAGTFALTPGSKDAALVATLPAGSYTVPVTATDGGAGVALLEVYKASTGTTSAVTAAATRAYVGTGDAVLIPGFIISGTGSLRLLIRAVGPTLATLGVNNVLADPMLTLYSGSTVLSTSDNWSSEGNATAIAAAAASVGDFALPVGSKDAALVTTLTPGAYTVVVSGVGNTTGTALVEIYTLP